LNTKMKVLAYALVAAQGVLASVFEDLLPELCIKHEEEMVMGFSESTATDS